MNGEPHIFHFPDHTPSTWKVMLIPGTWWHIQPGQKPPNAFHRFMHRIAFGLKWERV